MSRKWLKILRGIYCKILSTLAFTTAIFSIKHKLLKCKLELRLSLNILGFHKETQLEYARFLCVCFFSAVIKENNDSVMLYSD